MEVDVSGIQVLPAGTTQWMLKMCVAKAWTVGSSPELALKRERDVETAPQKEFLQPNVALQQKPPKKVKCAPGSSPGDHCNKRRLSPPCPHGLSLR